MSNVWNIESRNNPASMPFAGTAKKITGVNSRDAYRNDHHRNLFGTDKATPFEKGKETGWQTTTTSHFKDGGNPDQMKAAGSGDPKMAWAAKSQRTTGVKYTGI